MLDKITIEITPSLTGPWAKVTTHEAGSSTDKTMSVSLATDPNDHGHPPLVVEAAQAALRAVCRFSLPKDE
jgi:hypothetical protein